VAARKALEAHMCQALKDEANTKPTCPLGAAVYGNKPVPSKWGKFGISNVWAAQGNTIPATFWTMAYIMSVPEVQARVETEVRQKFASQPDSNGHFDYDTLEYTEACFKEALRLKATGAEFRIVLEDHIVTMASGTTYHVKKGQELYNSSYFQHHSEKIWDEPESYNPDRWLGANKIKLKEYQYLPFGAGDHVCAGRFLAKAEIMVFVALLFRDYDCALTSDWPGTLWANAVGVVRPDRELSFSFKRVQ